MLSSHGLFSEAIERKASEEEHAHWMTILLRIAAGLDQRT